MQKKLLNTIKLSSKHYLDETSSNFVYGLIIAKSTSSLMKFKYSEKINIFLENHYPLWIWHTRISKGQKTFKAKYGALISFRKLAKYLPNSTLYYRSKGRIWQIFRLVFGGYENKLVYFWDFLVFSWLIFLCHLWDSICDHFWTKIIQH